MGGKVFVVLAASVATLVLAAGAQAITRGPKPLSGPATLTVGCPGSLYRHIKTAVDHANPGDTVMVCAGTYVEGTGLVGSDAIIINKNLTLEGAGADQVTVEPKKLAGATISEARPNIRNGKGVILAVIGQQNKPVNVDVSGITFDAHGVQATAGVVFLDAGGSLDRSRVTGLDLDESANGYLTSGGFRNNSFGDGVVMATRITPPAHPSGHPKPIPPRVLTIDHTRVDHYNAIGVLIDAATAQTTTATTAFTRKPFAAAGVIVPSGVSNQAILTNDEIIGRNLCQNYNDPTLPPAGSVNPTVIDGDCQASGSGATGIHPPLPLTTGPLFGQDGVQVNAGASVQMTGDTVSSNLVNGTNSPIQTPLAPTPNNDPYPLGNNSTNNANLRLGAGVRLVGAAASSITQSNITDNAFGVLNSTLDGTTANLATPVAAQNNWWGLRTGTVTLPTPGPAVWPNVVSPSATTYNPPVPENPVNGDPVADANCPGSVQDSDAVTFCPYRSSDQSDTLGGEFPVAQAPVATGNPTATCTNTVQYDSNIPSYDSFFGTTLGSGTTGDGLSGGTPSAKKTAQLNSYMAAVVAAINNPANASTTGQRVAAQMVQEGTSVLGVPIYYVVIGTPTNIANLSSDQAFWRGVIDGTTSQAAALAAVNTRPTFGWVTGAPHGNEPAGGEGTTKELYELAARTDCDNVRRLTNLDLFMQPVTAPDDRDHNNRTLAWAFDPNRDRGTIQNPENKGLMAAITKYPGLFFIDAHQQTSGYFFPPDQDAALNEISHAALDEIQDIVGPGIQQTFNDQSSQYRNYNTYDLFVPEYGDTVPSLVQGGAGMTYEKGNTENYGKQVYDHYLAMDTTINDVSEHKADLLTTWVKQWQEAVVQGQNCQQQDNTQVSPPLVDLYEVNQSTIDQEPNTTNCGFYFLPNGHSGDVAQTIKDLQLVGVNVYKLTSAVSVPGVHQFGNFDISATQGGATPAVQTATTNLPAGTLWIPLSQGNKHWILAVLAENPYLPFNYFYDQVTWSYSMLRGFSGDGFLTQPMPGTATMTQIADPAQNTTLTSTSNVYAFNTDSMAGLAMVNQLLGQGATVARGSVAFDSGGVHFDTGAALVSGPSVSLSTLNADSAQWETPVYGLTNYPVNHYAIGVPKIAVYTGATTAPTNPAFHGTGDGYCTSTVYCEMMFDLTQKEGVPTSEITQVTSTDLAAGTLVTNHFTAFINPGSTIAAGAGATALQAFINGGGTYIGTVANGATSARNAGVTTLNTSTVSGLSTPGSTFDATWTTSDPEGWGFDSGGWIYRDASNNPTFTAASLAGNGGTIGPATAVATYAPAGDCGGPAGFGNCYGYEINANTGLPTRPVVVDQPFGSGHAIMLGFDAWYRAWTTEEERLVLNGVLYPTGTVIPPGSSFLNDVMNAAHAKPAKAPLAASRLPQVANRPLRPSGSVGTDVLLKVDRSQAALLRSAVKAASLPANIAQHVHYVTTRTRFEVMIRGVRTGDMEQRSGWESQLLGSISARHVKLILGQI